VPFGNCEVPWISLPAVYLQGWILRDLAPGARGPGHPDPPIEWHELGLEAVILSYPVVWGGRSSQDPAPIALGIYPGVCFFLQLLELACVRGALFTTQLSWALSVWTGLILEMRE